MIDHLSIPVRDHAASKTFYLAALAPLGIGVIMEVTRKESGGSTAHYHPQYDGAFVIDPNGVNLEAVCLGRYNLQSAGFEAKIAERNAGRE